MGSRRLGRKRLFSLDKAGQSLTASNGSGTPGCASFNQHREGNMIISEFTIDLGASTGAVTSPGSAKIIGLSASHPVAAITAQSRSNMLLVDRAIHGLITDAELVCVETPAGSGADTDIDLAVLNKSDLAAQGGFSGSATGVIINAGTQTAPMSTASDMAGTDIDNKYLVLQSATNNGVKGTYSAGKFIIRLFGYITPDDV